MAAYAAVVSVMNIMEQIQNHPCHSFSFDSKQIESLRENVDFLVDFLESYSDGRGSKAAEDLESRIASAAHEAEDVIESHVVDQIHDGTSLNGETSSCFLPDLQKVIEQMDSIKEIAVKVKVRRGFRDIIPTYSRPANATSSIGKNSMVGFDDELIQLMERLTGPQRDRLIIPIVGMGGIGKTTLARNVYQHSVIVQHFDVRLWTTISQDYSVEQILLELLSCLGKSRTSKNVNEIGGQLHKHLFGRRYLVVLDDVWNIEAWDEIKLFFPDNGNRSRIVVTTRISNMAFDSSSSSFVMNFLDEDRSWKLFCEKAFGGEGSCPLELEEIGKKIVKSCKGLPLSIVVIGGHLGKSSGRKEYWETVANDVNSILNSDDDEQCLNILLLSYSHLPIHLKPCFLYMGIFAEDREIFANELIRLWVAEGFLKSSKAQSLEEIANGCLKDLVERNLIQVRTWSRNGKIGSCSLHDLLRELCLKISEKEKFFCVLDTPQAVHRDRHVVIHEKIPEVKHKPEVFHALKSAQLLRSLNCEGGELLFEFRLLRVLNWVQGLMRDVNVRSLDAHFQQVNLRYLNYMYHLNYVFSSPPFYPSLYLPSSVSLLWNLQSLIINGECQVIAPAEIWEMPQLRHLQIIGICLPDPLPSDTSDRLVLRNLQTLLGVVNFRLSEEVCKRIPNIKEFHILYPDFPSGCDASTYYCPQNLCCFHKLESLRLDFSEEPYWHDFVVNLTFPSSLQELSLRNCFLRWEDLTIIGSLPHLEVLILLGANPVLGPEWNPIEGEFSGLKSLEIYACEDLICWNADNSHFPTLGNLILGGMSKLDVIPSGIGEIPTLEQIQLYGCSVSAAISAITMLVEQESFGNEGLRLHVELN